jgi:hypothetical protein
MSTAAITAPLRVGTRLDSPSLDIDDKPMITKDANW